MTANRVAEIRARLAALDEASKAYAIAIHDAVNNPGSAQRDCLVSPSERCSLAAFDINLHAHNDVRHLLAELTATMEVVEAARKAVDAGCLFDVSSMFRGDEGIALEAAMAKFDAREGEG
jgi:hypothetical protein